MAPRLRLLALQLLAVQSAALKIATPRAVAHGVLLRCEKAVSYTHLTLPTTPYV